MSSLKGDPITQPNAAESSNTTLPHALSSDQEFRLVNYVDDHILQIQRQYKKRKYEDSSLRTLSAYLKAMHPLLTLILMIPPITNSAPLRTALLLRITGEILECAPGYPLDDPLEFLETLTNLDMGWLTVLRSQVWNPKSCEGEDLVVGAGINLDASPVSQTDRTRLRSLLISATDKLEEWIEYQIEMVGDATQASEVQQKFDDIFHLTLSELGELRGSL